MITHITVHTAKLEETLGFYQWLLDLPVSMRINTPGGEIVFLGEDETKFELIEDSKAERISAKSLSIGFAVNNLEEKLAMLDVKKIPHSDVISPAPNTRFAFFDDLNGCSIQLFEVKH